MESIYIVIYCTGGDREDILTKKGRKEECKKNYL